MQSTHTGHLRLGAGLVAMAAVLALVAFMTMVSTNGGTKPVSAEFPKQPILKVDLTMHRYGTTITPWNKAKIDEELAKANAVWLKAGIQFTWLNRAFYDLVDSTPGPTSNGDVSGLTEKGAVCAAANTAQVAPGKANAFPVVWVQAFQPGKIGSTIFLGGVPQCLMVSTDAQTEEEDIPIIEGGSKKGETFAHELGHMLGLADIVNESNNLMGDAMPTDQKLTKDDITTARAAAQARIDAGGGQNVNGSDGTLSGIADLQIVAGTFTLHHCISRIDHDATTNVIRSSQQCYSDLLSSGDPNNLLSGVNVPGEGPDGGNSTLGNAGPPPPPPYTSAQPSKAVGFYDPTGAATECGGTPCTVTLGCVPRTGAGALGPNLGSRTITFDPETTDPTTGTIELYPGLSNADCDNLVIGTGAVQLTFTSTDAAGANQVAWRTSATDFDGDGCSDFDELAKPDAIPKGCGDDPYNPTDSNQTDFTGAYSISVEVTRAGAAPDPETPGSYFSCLADIQQTGNGKTDGDLVARAFCYTDGSLPVNNLGYPGVQGDGFPGGGPPWGAIPIDNTPACVAPDLGVTCNADGSEINCGRFGPASLRDEDGDGTVNDGCPAEALGDTDSKQTVLTGYVDNADNTLKLRGCFEDEDASSFLINVYVELTVNRNTGVGTVDIWPLQTLADCTASYAWGDYINIGGAPLPAYGDADVTIVRQPGDKTRDSDQDGISNAQELRDDGANCGLRDPFNPYDWYDVNAQDLDPGPGEDLVAAPDGVIDLANDILGVIQHYSPAGADPYDVIWDRGKPITGGAGNWSREAPDGVIDLANDILGVIQQYHPGAC